MRTQFRPEAIELQDKEHTIFRIENTGDYEFEVKKGRNLCGKVAWENRVSIFIKTHAGCENNGWDYALNIGVKKLFEIGWIGEEDVSEFIKAFNAIS